MAHWIERIITQKGRESYPLFMELSLAGPRYVLQSGALYVKHHRGITEALIHAID